MEWIKALPVNRDSKTDSKTQKMELIIPLCWCSCGLCVPHKFFFGQIKPHPCLSRADRQRTAKWTPTTSKGKSVYSSSEQTHLKSRWKACRRREGRDAMNPAVGVTARASQQSLPEAFMVLHSGVYVQTDRNSCVMSELHRSSTATFKPLHSRPIPA